MRHTVALRSGTLHLDVEETEVPLEELCGFAARRSHKRGFLIVSKVLGKHIPVDPQRMEQTHRRLAELLSEAEVPGPVVLIALAETATALGQGVFEQFLRHTGRDDVLFLHTTRYRLRLPLAFTFEESHSHATEHLLYRPVVDEDAKLFAAARSLILVDDEISSGRTLVNLARAYRRLNPELKSVHLVCLTDWMGAARRAEIAAELQIQVVFHRLLHGSLRFEPAAYFDPGPIPNVVGGGDFKDALLPRTGGRQGLRRPLELDLSSVDAPWAGRRLVLGTGEFSYPPYLLALRLRQQGSEVHYQSTTRSPILLGGDIRHVVEFTDNYGDEMPNYVYNLNPAEYDGITVCYETAPLPRSHTLAACLGARAVTFGAV